jgi:hypothetical protein
VHREGDLINFVKKKKVSTGDKTKDKKIQSIIIELTSGNEQKISKAISALQSTGKASMIPVLANLLRVDLSDKNRNELIELFNGLKDTDAIPYMIDLIRDDNNADIRQVLLTTIWSSKLDYSEYLPDFVSIATEGDFMEALECLTIIENLEGPFTEQLILESQLHLKDYIQDSSPKDPQKSQIMSEIALFLKELNENDGDGIEDFL